MVISGMNLGIELEENGNNQRIYKLLSELIFREVNMKVGIYKMVKKFWIFVLVTVTLIISLGALNLKAKSLSADPMDKNENKALIFPSLYQVIGDRLYYISLYDNNIYSTNSDGSDKKTVFSGTASEIGLINFNNSLYYIDVTDDYSLYRLDIEGKGNRISRGSLRINYESFFLYNNSLYYFQDDNTLYKLNENGVGGKVNNQSEKGKIEYFELNSMLVSDCLYSWGREGIFKRNISTGEKSRICSGNIYSQVEYSDGWIYYVNYNDLKLYRIDKDGKHRECISDGCVIQEGADFDGGAFQVYKGSIYYTIFSADNETALYCMSIESKKVKILVKNVVYFNIRNNCIYAMDSFDNGVLWKMDVNGNAKKKITEGSFMPLIEIENNLLIYGVKSESLDEPYWGRVFVSNLDKEVEFELK
jgi:hypothetical protein